MIPEVVGFVLDELIVQESQGDLGSDPGRLLWHFELSPRHLDSDPTETRRQI